MTIVFQNKSATSDAQRSLLVIRRSSFCHGYILLELIIALSMFAIAVVGLSKSLNTTLEVGNIMNRDYAVRVGLRSFVEEIKRKAVTDMVTSVTDDRLDAVYSSEVNPLQLTIPRSGASIPDAYEMKAKAVYTVGGQEREETITMWFYQPQAEQDKRRAR
jgi:hypothetical protein